MSAAAQRPAGQRRADLPSGSMSRRICCLCEGAGGGAGCCRRRGRTGWPRLRRRRGAAVLNFVGDPVAAVRGAAGPRPGGAPASGTSRGAGLSAAAVGHRREPRCGCSAPLAQPWAAGPVRAGIEQIPSCPALCAHVTRRSRVLNSCSTGQGRSAAMPPRWRRICGRGSRPRCRPVAPDGPALAGRAAWAVRAVVWDCPI